MLMSWWSVETQERTLGMCMIPAFFCLYSVPYCGQVIIFYCCWCFYPSYQLQSSMVNSVVFIFPYVTECVIDCLKFVSSHALGVTVMALSSYDPNVRAAAYHVLSCFYQHLEGARFREKRQVKRHGCSVWLLHVWKSPLDHTDLVFVKQLLYLMDTVKNGIRQKNQRLPFVLTTYITKVAQQMLKPGV